MRNWIAVLLLIVLAACGSAANFWVTIAFPDQEARDRTDGVEIFAISPDGDAGCQALIDGTAAPGDQGYTIDDQVTVDYPSLSGARPLGDIGPGRRLFFGRASDSDAVVILRGCSDQQAGGGGQREVVIQLEWACRPTNGGVESCDGRDNDCDGQTDDGDPVFLCPAVEHASASDCTDGRCGYTCAAGYKNANGEWSDGCECRPTRQGVEWCDGLDNDCDGQVDGADCVQCASDSDCQDPASCLAGACSGGVCSAVASPDGTACDDGLYCSTGDSCLSGVCSGTARDCSSLDDECNAGTCDELADACQAQPLDDDTPCDDGLYCSVDDACKSGICSGADRDCSQADSDCQLGTCNENTKVCEGRAKLNGTPCTSDAVFCNGAEECQAGACLSPGNPCPDPADCDESADICAGCGDGQVSAGEDCDPAAPSSSNCCDPATCLFTPGGMADPQQVCPAGSECRPGVCDGAGGCTQIDAPDGTPCTDDGMFCDGVETCQSGSCTNSGNPCPGPDGDANCGESCNESADDCSGPDQDGAACDDGDICSQPDQCLSGICQGQPLDCSSLDGPCVHGACSQASGQCEPIFDDAGTACNDGIDCTSGDACDGLGTCQGAPNDDLCAIGSFCMPGCTSSADGCLLLPTLSVDCGDVAPASSATCQIVATPADSGLGGCLQCSAHLLEPELSRVDFGDGGAGCDLGGWQVEGGSYCQFDGAPNHCPLNAIHYGPHNCCANLVCPVMNGPLAGLEAMQADEGACSGAFEEYRLYDEFDLRAFDQASVCFDVAQYNLSSQDQFQVQQGTGGPDGQALYCIDGSTLLYPDDLARHCVGLADPSAQPLVRLDLWTHSEQPGDSWIIDNISLRAGYQGCQPTTRLVFEEHFDSCPTYLPDGYNDWTIAGDQIRCESYRCVSHGLHNERDNWSIEHAVDTTTLSGPVNLCWTMGADYNTDATLSVEFDTGAGTGWQTAYQSSGALTIENECLTECVDLAAIDPAAAGNPNLMIRFTADSQNKYVLLDDISVGGPARCDSIDRLQTGALVEQNGQYLLNVDNLQDRNYRVEVECSLSAGGTTVYATDDFSYAVE